MAHGSLYPDAARLSCSAVPFAAALSRHPTTAVAVGEVVGALIEQIGPAPDLAFVALSTAHVPHIEQAAATVQTLLDPKAFIGTSASGVVGGSEAVEDAPSIALWAARWDHPVDLCPVHVRALPVGGGGGPSGSGWTFEGLADGPGDTLLMMADPFTFPTPEFFNALARSTARTDVIGGLASGATAPGHNRLVIGGRVVRQGAVAVRLPTHVLSRVVVSQGCRPIGRPMTVTKSDSNLLLELAGRPALAQVIELLEGLDDHERRLAAQGLHCGIVVNESRLDFDRGDFLIRGVMGADRSRAAIAIGDMVPVGTTVQFQVRDAVSAADDLIECLGDTPERGALLFTCNGRGAAMFGHSDHDAHLVSERVGPALAGLFCAGEIGPIGARNALHGFTASLALFRS